METLDDTHWDIVIAGTGLPQSLLALSLSRSGKRILHLDRNDYYGGDEAALSLTEAEAWATKYASQSEETPLSHASISTPNRETGKDTPALSSSRAYSLALAPQLLYARSPLLPALVSSHTQNQLDFQAVGSWFVLDATTAQPTCTRVPSGREDVFQDHRLGLKEKRALMRFLRFVANHEEQADVWQDHKDMPFAEFLEQVFALPSASHGSIMALTMSDRRPSETSTETALPRIARHLRSIGVFGPGFGAVLPKWGGLAEIAQVACRACAVGGGVYVLNKGIKNVTEQVGDERLSLALSDGEDVKTRWLVGGLGDLPSSVIPTDEVTNTITLCKSISVISSPLPQLFPPTSEGGVTPAGAVVVIPSSSTDEPPVYILVHTSDAGECPMDQCILYASTMLSHSVGFERLDQAASSLLQSVDDGGRPEVLWKMRYQQQIPARPQIEGGTLDSVIALPPLSTDLALEDIALDGVKEAWWKLTGSDESKFMQFEAREGLGLGDDNE